MQCCFERLHYSNMTESSSFSSLMALVDSHLSMTNVQESRSENGNSRVPFTMPSLHDSQNSTMSDTLLSFSPNQRLPLPSLNLGGGTDSSIKSVLAEQVANMLRNKELKRQKEEEEKERQRLEEEMKKMKLEEEDDCVIDLMQALQSCQVLPPATQQNDIISSSSSFESLFEPQFIDCDDIPIVPKTPEPKLPCTTDMSYLLQQKVPMAKCSAFGKVLTSRLKPVAAPYLYYKMDSTVKRFDFSTQSPCDVIKEKLRRPTTYNNNNDTYNIF